MLVLAAALEASRGYREDALERLALVGEMQATNPVLTLERAMILAQLGERSQAASLLTLAAGNIHVKVPRARIDAVTEKLSTCHP